MLTQTANSNLVFKIKLLSGENIVLVDCQGFESELFMPQIVKGRITFQNIIPKHRCCDTAAADARTDQLILPVHKFGNVRVLAGPCTPQRISCGPYVGNLSCPLARSTPSSGARSNKENEAHIQTPEQTRFHPPKQSVIPDSLNVMPLETSSAIQYQEAASVSSSILMNSPLRPSHSSTLTNSIKSSNSPRSGLMLKAPARTYARKKLKAPNIPKSPISWSPLKKKKKTSKVSSTKPPCPSMKLEIRHRKLIVDSKKTLPIQDLLKTAEASVSKTKIRRKQVTAKTRVQFDALKGTAFDQLTSPALTNVSNALKSQFQNACIEKFSETLPNYAELSRTRPLQMDRQVRSLVAKEKRLEKEMSQSQKACLIKRNKT